MGIRLEDCLNRSPTLRIKRDQRFALYTDFLLYLNFYCGHLSVALIAPVKHLQGEYLTTVKYWLLTS